MRLSFSTYETFEEQPTAGPTTSSSSSSGVILNQKRNDKINADPIFCGKGMKYDKLQNKCEPCEDRKYQDNETPHRIVECKDQPELGPSDCADGKYFFVDESGVNSLYNATKDRILTSTDFCSVHEVFGPMDCDPNTFLQSSKIPELRKTIKDRKLTKVDYCSPQPDFDSITCEETGFFENKTLYDQIVTAREKKSTQQNICSNSALNNKDTTVVQTAFDQESNKRSFRTVRLTGRMNNDGKISLKPTSQKAIKTMDTPDTSRSASTVWSGQNMGVGHGRGRLDSGQGWSSQHNAWGQWYQIDVGTNMTLTVSVRVNSWLNLMMFNF